MSDLVEYAINVVIPVGDETLAVVIDDGSVDEKLSASAESEILDSGPLENMRRAWDILAVRDGEGNLLQFPPIACVKDDGSVMNVADLVAYANKCGKSAEELCREIKANLWGIYMNILSHLWKYHDPIVLYNSDNLHWQQLIVPEDVVDTPCQPQDSGGGDEEHETDEGALDLTS
jgi:hypothetical protein